MPKEIGEMITKWQKLDRTCKACGLGHANIEFTFATRHGSRGESYHFACMPKELGDWQRSQEADMIEYAQTPPGSS